MDIASGRIALLKSSQLTMEGVFPGVLKLAEGDDGFPVARSAEVIDESGVSGGYEDGALVSIRARVEFIPPDGLPRGTKITLDGRGYRVQECSLEPDDVAWWIELKGVGAA